MSDQPKQKFYPAYFSKLYVKLKCFKEKQELNLTKEDGSPAMWTVILGDNGTGKTSVLQSFVSIKPGNTSKIYDTKTNDFLGVSYNPTTFRKYDKILFKGEDDLSIGCKVAIKKNSSWIEFRNVLCKSYKGGSISYSGARLPSLNFIKLKIYAYGAARKMSHTALSPEEKPNATESLFGEKTLLENVEEFFLQAYFTAREAEGEVKEYAQKRYDKIKEVLTSGMLPDIEDIKPKAITKESMGLGIEVKTPYGWVRMKDLSMGYQTLMAWMVDLMSRLFDQYPDSDNPIAEPAVVLIDEIDLHLHPKWQQKLMGHLSKYFVNTQFIVTAHSPLIVQSDVEANIVVLKREGDSVVIHNNPVDVDGWRVDQLLTSDLFGLPSSRSPKYQKLLDEKARIFSKDQLTEEDKERLHQINAQLEALPYMESRLENKAMQLLKEGAEWLENQKVEEDDQD